MATVCYVLGDIHLNQEPSAFLSFLDELAQKPPARLVILGDLFEYWLESLCMELHHGPYLQRLRALKTAGWRLDLVPGNREMVHGPILAKLSGCTIHWPGLTLAIADKRWRVVHGDRLCYDPPHHLLMAWMRGFWWQPVPRVLPAFALNWIARYMRWRSRLRGLRHRRALRNGFQTRILLDYRRLQAAGRNSSGVIAGHIHEAWRRTIAQVELTLVGDWGPEVAHWVAIDENGQQHLCEKRYPIKNQT